MFLLYVLITTGHGQQWTCPSGETTALNPCCLSQPKINPHILEIEIDENWPVGSAVQFGSSDSIPFAYPTGNYNVQDYSLDVVEVNNEEFMNVDGIDNINICQSANGGICPSNLFSMSEARLVLQQKIDFKAMGGTQFKFSLKCSYLGVNEEYEVFLAISERDNPSTTIDNHHPAIINETGLAIVELGDGESGQDWEFDVHSYDFLSPDTNGNIGIKMSITKTEPSGYKNHFAFQTVPSNNVKNVLPGTLSAPLFKSYKLHLNLFL